MAKGYAPLRFPTGGPSVSIKFEGPLFSPDRDKLFTHNVRDLMAELARWGEQHVRSRLEASGFRNTAGRYRGRVTSLAGRSWRRSVVISPNTQGYSARDARSAMAAAHVAEYGMRRGRGRHDPLGHGRGKHAVSRTRTELSGWWRANGTRIVKGL